MLRVLTRCCTHWQEFILLFLVLATSGCILDQKSEVIVIANNTNSSIVVVKQPTQNITDSVLFKNQLDNSEFVGGEVRSIWLPDTHLRNLPNSERVYFYIFNTDSLDKYRNRNKLNGIFKKCLIKEFSLQLNQVIEVMDTIYVSDTGRES